VQISLSHPSRLGQLLAFLSFDETAVVRQIGDAEIEVWFIGSLNTWAQQRELELRLRAWLAQNSDVVVAFTG
jgi:hypothetical protein